MKAFWWNGAVHLEPEGEEDTQALVGLMRLFAVVEVPSLDEIDPSSRTVITNDKDSVPGAYEAAKMIAQTLSRAAPVDDPRRGKHSVTAESD